MAKMLLRGPLLFFLLLSLPAAMQAAPASVKAEEKCPVCGMFVAKYPDFIAEVVFSDGSHAVFDGAKDMFKYILGLHKYDAKRNPADIISSSVTDYYAGALIDGRKAFYVVGSDVYGPMGHELIPFSSQADAMEFMNDHSGNKLLRFDEVTLSLLEELK